MTMTENDLPHEWTVNYGAFISLGDAVVMATCRICFALVVSDFFGDHTHRHEVKELEVMVRNENVEYGEVHAHQD